MAGWTRTLNGICVPAPLCASVKEAEKFLLVPCGSAPCSAGQWWEWKGQPPASQGAAAWIMLLMAPGNEGLLSWCLLATHDPQSFEIESHLPCRVWTDEIMCFHHQGHTLSTHPSAFKVNMRDFKLGNVLSFLKDLELFYSDFFLKCLTLVKNNPNTSQGMEEKPLLTPKIQLWKEIWCRQQQPQWFDLVVIEELEEGVLHNLMIKQDIFIFDLFLCAYL